MFPGQPGTSHSRQHRQVGWFFTEGREVDLIETFRTMSLVLILFTLGCVGAGVVFSVAKELQARPGVVCGALPAPAIPTH